VTTDRRPDGEPTSRDLSFGRVKKRSIVTAVAFRSRPILIKFLGRRRVLMILLQASRVISRLAWETAGDYFGEGYFNAVHALSPGVLRDWLPAGATVVDIGCGAGRVSRLVGDRAHSVLGVDRNPIAVDTAERARHPGNVSFRTGDAHDITERFDAAIVSHLLGHLDDPDAFLAAAHAIAPMLLVEVPDVRGDALNIARISLGLDFSTDADYVREYSKETLLEQLQRNHWRVTAWAHGYQSLGALARSDRQLA
jgi:SAM-dependent methyltransferase